METVRFRVVFEDRHILSKSQRLDGLKRSWLLLKPPHETFSDLSSYLAHVFDLYDSCPNGIILSMDGFVLPPFESTCILKDKDVVRVKKKEGILSEIVEVGDGANLIEDNEIVEKQSVLTSVPLLANDEFEKESSSYQSESEEDEDNQSEDILPVENSSGRKVVSKKRKASKKLQSSKKKQKCSTDPEDIENDFHIEQESCGLHSGKRIFVGKFHPGKSVDKKKKVSLKGWKGRGFWCPLQSRIGAKHSLANMLVKCKTKTRSTPRSAERNNDIFEPLPSTERSGQLQENDTICVDDVPQMPDGTRKVPSRSARRKKAKRQWLRELVKAEKKELVMPNLQPHQVQSPEKEMLKNSIEHQQQNQNGEADNEIVADDEIVPIVIRPGHIRFEPLGEDQAVQQNQVSVETFQWNGITSKKKGQKWGMEKFPCRRNDYKDSNEERSEMMTIEKVDPPNHPIDFDKLATLASLPKEGDVIAYRLLELSSTWTPELSTFRVGKTSSFDPESDRILLTPVPEYPIIFDQPDEDACAQPPDNTLYGEDGSLEIDFSSLVDVRIVKHGNSDPAKAVTGSVNDRLVGNEVSGSTVVPCNNDKQTHTPTSEKVPSHNDKQTLAPNSENGGVNVWDEVSEALNAKKAQLIRENGGSNESSGRSSWSYRAMRGSALGPTMAILRARNDI